jgi:hypothetical protein
MKVRGPTSPIQPAMNTSAVDFSDLSPPVKSNQRRS